MATSLQNAIQLPILMELAIRGEAVQLGKDGDLLEFQDWVADYYPHTIAKAKSRSVKKNDQSEYYNSHQWAVKQLKTSKYIRGRKYVDFEITKLGLEYLRNQIHAMLQRPSMAKSIDTKIRENDENGREQFIGLLAHLPEETLYLVILGGTDSRQVFLDAFRNVPLESLGKVLISIYELVKPMVALTLAKRHRLSTTPL